MNTQLVKLEILWFQIFGDYYTFVHPDVDVTSSTANYAHHAVLTAHPKVSTT